MDEKTTRPTGRPRLADPSSRRIMLRVTTEQEARYKAAAEAAGLTLTAWIESYLDRAAPRR